MKYPAGFQLLGALLLVGAASLTLTRAANNDPWSGLYAYVPSCNDTACCCPPIGSNWTLVDYNVTSRIVGVNITIMLNTSNPLCGGFASDLLVGNQSMDAKSVSGQDQAGLSFTATLNATNLNIVSTTASGSCTASAICFSGNCLVSKNPSNASPQGQNSSNPNAAASPASHPSPTSVPNAASAVGASSVAATVLLIFFLASLF